MLYENIIGLGASGFTATDAMTRDEWLALRRTGIGGSDAGAIIGLNKYATPLSVFFSKKELVKDFEGNAATEWGNILEAPIREKAKEELEIAIETVPGMFRSLEYPFMTANLDSVVFIDGEKEIAGITVSGLGGHEIKTSRTGDGFTADEIPDSYYCQVQHYMAVTGLQFFVLTVYIIDRYEGKHYAIPRNEEFIERLVKAESDFWNFNIEQNNMPAPTGNGGEADLINSLPMAENIQLDAETEGVVDKLQEIKAQIKELETEKTSLEEKIKLAMFNASENENADKTTAICGGWKITYNTQRNTRIDTDAIRKAGLYEAYSKTSVSKVMRISANK